MEGSGGRRQSPVCKVDFMIKVTFKKYQNYNSKKCNAPEHQLELNSVGCQQELRVGRYKPSAFQT